MDIEEIVMKLVGPITPRGDSRADEERLKNLHTLIEVVDCLLGRIALVSSYAERPEGSMADMGKVAQRFMEELREQLKQEATP